MASDRPISHTFGPNTTGELQVWTDADTSSGAYRSWNYVIAGGAPRQWTRLFMLSWTEKTMTRHGSANAPAKIGDDQ